MESFSEQCRFLLINNGPFSKHSELSHIAAALKALGPNSYQVFNNLNFDAEAKDKTKRIISELRTFDLDDCRQSSVHAHAHCLRNEQCTCTCNLNKQDGCQMVCMFDQVLDQTKALS